uniref:DNA-directed RNA polymerase subunit beta'' n=1 Tax=Hazenia capsulata TaxID=2202518 RepID=A0A1W6EHH7_9CHLO|nr:beta'' subunit of RNA polymerase [Hazenia capsulata]ARK14874.1 beta'' subunit of RNA polymerase [Hazenia capsulata]
MFTKKKYEFHFCTKSNSFGFKIKIQKHQDFRFFLLNLQQNCKISNRLKPLFASSDSSFSTSFFYQKISFKSTFCSLQSFYFLRQTPFSVVKNKVKNSVYQAKKRSPFHSKIMLNHQLHSLNGLIDSRENNQNFFFNRAFDKNRLKALISWSVFSFGENKTINLVEKLKSIGYSYATKAGISLSIDDLKIPSSKNEFLYQAEYGLDFLNQQVNKGHLTSIEYFSKVIETWNKTSESLKEEVIANFRKNDELNPVFLMAFSGARGNMSQVRQLTSMRGLMSDPQGKIINFPIQSNFREGLTLTEYIISCYGARKGVVDTALRTATSGYLTRRLVDVAQHVIIRGFNCGTQKGIYLTDLKKGTKILLALKNRLLGRRLAEDIYDSKNELIATRNQEINAHLSVLIAKTKTHVLVRSPITCQEKDYVCQLCYGWSLATHRLVPSGEAVGIIAGQSIGEPGTQLTMRTFHTGGVFSGEVSAEIKAPVRGLVFFKTSIPGKVVRTMYGQMAFLTKQESLLFLNYEEIKEKNTNDEVTLKPLLESQKKEILKIPAYTLLFVKQNQLVEKDQILGEAFAFLAGQNQSVEAYQTLYSDLSGEIRFQRTKRIRKKKNYLAPIEKEDFLKTNIRKRKKGKNILNSSASTSMGEFWVLSAQKQTVLEPTNLIVKPGDYLHQNATIYLSKTYPALLASFNFFKKPSFLTSVNQTGQAAFFSSVPHFSLSSTVQGKNHEEKFLPLWSSTNSGSKKKKLKFEPWVPTKSSLFFYDFGHFLALKALKQNSFCSLNNFSSKKLFKKGNSFLRPTNFCTKKNSRFKLTGEKSKLKYENSFSSKKLNLSVTNLQKFSFLNSNFLFTEIFSNQSFSVKSHFKKEGLGLKTKLKSILFLPETETQKVSSLETKKTDAILNSKLNTLENFKLHQIGFLPLFKTPTGGFIAMKRKCFTTFQSKFKISALFLLPQFKLEKKNFFEFFEQNKPRFSVATLHFEFFEPFTVFNLQQTPPLRFVVIGKTMKLRSNLFGKKSDSLSEFVDNLSFPFIEKTKTKLKNENFSLKFIKANSQTTQFSNQILSDENREKNEKRGLRNKAKKQVPQQNKNRQRESLLFSEKEKFLRCWLCLTKQRPKVKGFAFWEKTRLKSSVSPLHHACEAIINHLIIPNKCKNQIFWLKPKNSLLVNVKAKINTFYFKNKKKYTDLKKSTLNNLPKTNNLITVYSFSANHFIGLKKRNFSKQPFRRKAIGKSLRVFYPAPICTNTSVEHLNQKQIVIPQRKTSSALSAHRSYKVKSFNYFFTTQNSKAMNDNKFLAVSQIGLLLNSEKKNKTIKKTSQAFNNKFFKISQSWTVQKGDDFKNQLEKQMIQFSSPFKKKRKTLKQILPLTNLGIPVLNCANSLFWFSKEQKVLNPNLSVLDFLTPLQNKSEIHFGKRVDISQRYKLKNLILSYSEKPIKHFNVFNFSNFFKVSRFICPTSFTFLQNFVPQLKIKKTDRNLKNSFLFFSLAKNKNLATQNAKNLLSIKIKCVEKNRKLKHKNIVLNLDTKKSSNTVIKDFEKICLKLQLLSLPVLLLCKTEPTKLDSQSEVFVEVNKPFSRLVNTFSYNENLSKTQNSSQQKRTIFANTNSKVLLSLSNYQILRNYKNRSFDLLTHLTKPNLLNYSPVFNSFLNSALFLNTGLLKKKFLFEKLKLLTANSNKEPLLPCFILFKNNYFKFTISFAFFKKKDQRNYSNSLILVKKKHRGFLVKGLTVFHNTFTAQSKNISKTQESVGAVSTLFDFCLQRKTTTRFIAERFQPSRGNSFFALTKKFFPTKKSQDILGTKLSLEEKSKDLMKQFFPVTPMFFYVTKKSVFFRREKKVKFFCLEKSKNNLKVSNRNFQNSFLTTWFENKNEYENILETLKFQIEILNTENQFFLSENFLNCFDKTKLVSTLQGVSLSFIIPENLNYYQQLLSSPINCLIRKKILKNSLTSYVASFAATVSERDKAKATQKSENFLQSTTELAKVETLSFPSIDINKKSGWFEKEKVFKISTHYLNYADIIIENKKFNFLFFDLLMTIFFFINKNDFSNKFSFSEKGSLPCNFSFLSFLIISPFFCDLVLQIHTKKHLHKKNENFSILSLKSLSHLTKQNQLPTKMQFSRLNSSSLLSTKRLKLLHSFQSDISTLRQIKQGKANLLKIYTPKTVLIEKDNITTLDRDVRTAVSLNKKAESRLAKFNKIKEKKNQFFVQERALIAKKKGGRFSKVFLNFDKVLIMHTNIKNFRFQKQSTLSKIITESNGLLTICPGWLFTNVFSNQTFVKHNNIQLPGNFIIDDIAFGNYVTLTRFLPVRFQNHFYQLQTHVNFWLKTIKTFSFNKTRCFAFLPQNETVLLVTSSRQKEPFASQPNQSKRLTETNSLLNKSCFSRLILSSRKTKNSNLVREKKQSFSFFLAKSKKVNFLNNKSFSLTFEKEFLFASELDKFELFFNIIKTNLLHLNFCYHQEIRCTKFMPNAVNRFAKTFSLRSAVILAKKSKKLTSNDESFLSLCKKMNINNSSLKKAFGKQKAQKMKSYQKIGKKLFILHPSSFLKSRFENSLKNLSYSKFIFLAQQQTTVSSTFFKDIKKPIYKKQKTQASKSNFFTFFDKTNLISPHNKKISLFKKVFILKEFLSFFFTSLIVFSGKTEFNLMNNKTPSFSNYPLKNKLLSPQNLFFSFTNGKNSLLPSRLFKTIAGVETGIYKSIKKKLVGFLNSKMQSNEQDVFFNSNYCLQRQLFVTLLRNFVIQIKKQNSSFFVSSKWQDQNFVSMLFTFHPKGESKSLTFTYKVKAGWNFVRQSQQNSYKHEKFFPLRKKVEKNFLPSAKSMGKTTLFLPETHLIIVPMGAGIEMQKLTGMRSSGFYINQNQKTEYETKIFLDLVYQTKYQRTDTKSTSEIYKTNKQIINNYCRLGNFKTLKFPGFFDQAIINYSVLKFLPNFFKIHYVFLQKKENKKTRVPLLKTLEFQFNKNTRFKPKLLLLGKTKALVKKNLPFTGDNKSQVVRFIEKPLNQGVLSFESLKAFSFFSTVNKTLVFVQKATQYATGNSKNYKKKMYQLLDTSNLLKQNLLEESKNTGSKYTGIVNSVLFARNSRLTKGFRFTNSVGQESLSSLNPSLLQKKQTVSKLVEYKIQPILQIQWTFFNSSLLKKKQQQKYIFDLKEKVIFSPSRYTKTKKWIRYYRTQRGQNIKIRDLEPKEIRIDFFDNGKRKFYPTNFKNRELIFKNLDFYKKHIVEKTVKSFSRSKNSQIFHNQKIRLTFSRKKLANHHFNSGFMPFITHNKPINLIQFHFNIPEPVENPLSFLFLYNVNPLKSELFQHGFKKTSKLLLKNLGFQVMFPLLPNFGSSRKPTSVLPSEIKNSFGNNLTNQVKGLSSLQGEVFFVTETFPLKLVDLSVLKKSTPELRLLTDLDLLSFEIQKPNTRLGNVFNEELKQIKQTNKKKEKLQVSVGEFVRYGKEVLSNVGLNQSGQILLLQSNKIVLRYAKPFLLSSGGICNLVEGDFITYQAPLLTLKYKTLKTEDIVQGIPKIEQLFEARQNLERESGIPHLLRKKFLFYKNLYPKQKAVQKSIEFIQHYIIDGIQTVYQSQGVTISDKHVEIIVKQMTCKVKILDPGVSGLLRGDIVYLNVIELANSEIQRNNINYQGFRINKKKAEYEPVVLGISKAALTIRGFISAASFQETIKILTKAAIFRRSDFLRGLKENVILGHLIPSGTGADFFRIRNT